jgi:hypothetical protein
MLFLNVSTQPTKLEFTTQQPVLSLKTTPPKIQVSTEAATLEIHQQQGTLEIDQSPCRASYGLLDQIGFTQRNAQEGMRMAQEGVGRVVEEGNRLAGIDSHENALANIAMESTLETTGELTWARVADPIINYRPNPPDIRSTPGKVTINSQPAIVENNSHRGTIEGRVAQHYSMRMWTTENKIDMSV